MHLAELWGAGYEVSRLMQTSTHMLRFWNPQYVNVMSQRF